MKTVTCSYGLEDLFRDLSTSVPFTEIAQAGSRTMIGSGEEQWNVKLTISTQGKTVTVATPIWQEDYRKGQHSYVLTRFTRPSTDGPWYTARIVEHINSNRKYWIGECCGSTAATRKYTGDETVPCKICGEKTFMLGTKLCDGCWAVSNNFQYLVAQHPEAAKQWLEQQLYLLNTPKIRVLDPPQGLHEHYVQLDANGSVPCRGDLDCVFCKIAKGK